MNKDVLSNVIKKCGIYIVVLILVIIASFYFIVGIPVSSDAPLPASIENYKKEKQLVEEIKQKQSELNRILEDKKRKIEAAKKATVKDFYSVQNPSGDVVSEFAPMFDNIITMIKQNGIRMKSIKYNPNPIDDNLIKNGNSQYSGCRVNFELVGYYPQFVAFLNDINMYPYFINVSKFEIVPYQYDKRILIANVSIMFYSKR